MGSLFKQRKYDLNIFTTSIISKAVHTLTLSYFRCC